MAPKIIQFQLLQTHCRKGDDVAKNRQMSRWDVEVVGPVGLDVRPHGVEGAHDDDSWC